MQLFGSKISLLLFLVSTSISSFAQVLDTDITANFRKAGVINDVGVDSNGKVILHGAFDEYKGQVVKEILRLNSNGSIDEAFNQNIINTYESDQIDINSNFFSLEVLPDDKILFFGFVTLGDRGFVLINSDGTFNAEHRVSGFPSFFLVQQDGKIVYDGEPGLVRLNADFSLDTSFEVPLEGSLRSLTLLNDGNILVAGDLTNVAESVVNNIAVLDLDGNVINTFGTGANGSIDHATQTEENRIVISGSFSTFNDQAVSDIGGVNLNGDLEEGYDLIPINDRTIELLLGISNNEVLVGTEGGNFSLISANGELLNEYEAVGAQKGSTSPSTSTMDEGFIVASSQPGSSFFKLNATLDLDPSFDVGLGPTTAATTTDGVKLSDGSLVLIGDFNFYNNELHNGIVKINQDLQIDNTFDAGLGFDQSFLLEFFLRQSNDQIIVSGQFEFYNNQTVNGLIRINPDGSIDDSYPVSRSFDAIGQLQPDDKMVIATPRYDDFIRRYNTDGTLDESFQSLINFPVANFEPLNNGRLFIQSEFRSEEGNEETVQGFLNSDGSLDTLFNAGLVAEDYVSGILVTNDRIKMYGRFQGNRRVVVLSNTGERIETVDLDETLQGISARLFELSDKSVIAVAENIVRLSPAGDYIDGFLQANFTGDEFQHITSVLPIGDDAFLLLGRLLEIDGTPVQALVKYDFTAVPPAPEPPTDLTFTLDVLGRPMLSWMDNSNNETGFRIIRESQDTSIVFELAADINSFQDIDVDPNTEYIYTIVSYNGGGESASQEVTVTVGDLVTSISEQRMERSIFYPNPASNWLTIKHLDHKFTSYIIYDMFGVKLDDGLVPDTNRINIDQLVAGSYLLVLNSKLKNELRSFLVIK